MDTIMVDKADLIATLRDNRDRHRAIFIQAQEVYREKVVEALDSMLAEARRGGKIVTFVNLPTPEDHTSSFDTAIEMLEWHQDDKIELSRRDFTRYVQNKWEWEASFAANTMSYSEQLDAAERE